MTYSHSTLADQLQTLRDLMDSLDHTGDPLDTVQCLHLIAQTAQSALPHAVALARLNEATWEQIGRYTQTTRQAAHQRFSAIQ